MADAPVILTCAMSGALASRAQSPAIPYTPAEYAAEARRVVDEGGVMVHLHARTPDGKPSHEIEDFRAITDAIRDAVGEAVIVNSRPVRWACRWRSGSPTCANCGRRWRADMGSMNYAKYSERRKDFVFDFVFPNPFETSASAGRGCDKAGGRPELECFDSGHSTRAAAAGHGRARSRRCQYSFMLGVPAGSRAHGGEHRAHGRAGGPRDDLGLIGIYAVQWALFMAALVLGGNVRVGLEDNFYLPGGEMAR